MKFFSFWIFDPQKSKKQKLALENQQKMTQKLKIKKIHEKVQKAPQPYNFFGLMNFFWFWVILAKNGKNRNFWSHF